MDTLKKPQTTETNPDEVGDSKRRGRLDRRSFLRGLGMAAAGAAVLSQTDFAKAANGWNMGLLEDVSDEKLVELYTLMLKSRWWEEKIKDAFLAGEDDLYGAYHIYIGQEAVSTGAIGALTNADYIASTHRGHGHLIAKGGDLNRMSAEIYFKETGYNKAFGGSMHITDTERGILGMNGIVGPSYLLAAGAAYGIKVRGGDQVAMAFGGDGSVQNGWFWSAMRNAALYNLPLVAVVENNGMQISMPTENTIHLKDLSQIASGLEIPGYTVDGTDVLAVHQVARDAVARARGGQGPTLIEAKTYRWYDHAGLAGAEIGRMGAYGLPYRTDRELQAWMARDPIAKLRRTLVSAEVLTEGRADEIVTEVQDEVDASLEFARNSPLPAPDAALRHVYAEGTVDPSQQLA